MWDEQRLYGRAEQIVAREPAQPNIRPAQRGADVTQILRDRHVCTHVDFDKEDGYHDCDEWRKGV